MWRNQEDNPLDFLDEDEQGNYITNPVRLQTCLSQMRLLETKLRNKQTKIKTIKEMFSECEAKTEKYCSENARLKNQINQLKNEVLDLKGREKNMNYNLSEATVQFQKFIDESNMHKSEIERMSKENLELCSKLKELELEFVKRGQTEQTIHLNMTEALKQLNKKDGLGFDENDIKENPKFLARAMSKCCSLYNFDIIKIGASIDRLVFVRASDEEKAFEKSLEDAKRQRTNKCQQPFDYYETNSKYFSQDSIYTYKPKPQDWLPEDAIPTYSDNQNISVQPSKVLYYTPTLILEQHFEELQAYIFQMTVSNEIENCVLSEKLESAKHEFENKANTHVQILQQKQIEYGKLWERFCILQKQVSSSSKKSSFTENHVTKTSFDQKVMFYQHELRTKDEIIKGFEKNMKALDAQVLEKDELIKVFEKEMKSLEEQVFEKDEMIEVFEKEMKSLEAQVFELQKKNEDFGRKCLRREQTNQLIFPNKPKEFRFFKPQEGLGHDNKKYLKKAMYQAPDLYDSNLLGNTDTKMAFIRSSKDVEDQEDAKRPIFDKTQISFDYKSLNDSYKTRKIPLSDDYFPSYTEEELNSDDVLKQVVFQTVYVPTLLLEKQFSELEKTLECRTNYFENEKRNFLEKIASFEQASLDKSSTPNDKSSLENVDKIKDLSKQESTKFFSSNEKFLEKISFLKDALLAKDKDIDVLTEKINSMWKMNGSFSPKTPIISQEEKQKSKLVEKDSKNDVKVPLKGSKSESSKTFSKVISPNTTFSSKKSQKYSSKSQSNGTSTSSLKTSNSKSTILANKHVSNNKICSPMTKQETKSFIYSTPELFEFAPSHFKFSVQRAYNFVSKNKQQTPKSSKKALFQKVSSNVSNTVQSTKDFVSSNHSSFPKQKWILKSSQTSNTNNKTNFVPKTPPPVHQQKWIPKSSHNSNSNNKTSSVQGNHSSNKKQQWIPKSSQVSNTKNMTKRQQWNPKSSKLSNSKNKHKNPQQWTSKSTYSSINNSKSKISSNSKSNNKHAFVPRTSQINQQKWSSESQSLPKQVHKHNFVQRPSPTPHKQQRISKSQGSKSPSLSKPNNKNSFLARKWIPKSPTISKMDTQISKPVSSNVCLPEKRNSYFFQLINKTYHWFSSKANHGGPKLQWVPHHVKVDCAGK